MCELVLLVQTFFQDKDYCISSRQVIFFSMIFLQQWLSFQDFEMWKMIFPLVGFFGDTVFWNRHFSLQVPWLPVGGKVLRLWSLRSCKNAFWGVKYLTMLLYVTQQQNLHRLQKKHLDWVRTGRKSLLLASSISTQWLLLNYFQWKVLSL